MNELVRQFVLGAVLQWRTLLETVIEAGLDPVRDWDIHDLVHDELRVANSALKQLRYAWAFQEIVWDVAW